MNIFKLSLKIILIISLLVNSTGHVCICPEALVNGYVLRPAATNLSTAFSDRKRSASAGDPHADNKRPDLKSPGRRNFFISIAAAITGFMSLFILHTWNGKKPQKVMTVEQWIASLDASELAKKAVFLFGEKDRYKKKLLPKSRSYRPPPGDENIYNFIELYTKAEIYSLIEEALAWNRPMSFMALKRSGYDKAIEKKGREILRCQSAQSIGKKIAKAKNKTERLTIFLSMLNNLMHPFLDMDFSREDFQRLLETNGLGQLIREFPEMLSLPDILNKDLRVSITDRLATDPKDRKKKEEEADKRQEMIYEKVSFFNDRLFNPNGFYAMPYRSWTQDSWFFKIRNRFRFEGKRVIIIERLRYNRERLPMDAFSIKGHPEAGVAVLHEEATDMEALHTDTAIDVKRKEEEVQRQAALLLAKAIEENPELNKPGALTSYEECSLVLHELSHIIRDGTEKELIPLLTELAYGEPHLKARTLISRMMEGWSYDWLFTGIFAPVTGLEETLPESPEDQKRQRLLAVEKFISLDKDEIQKRSKEILKKKSPGVYEAFESEEGQRFRKNTLNEIKASNMPQEHKKNSRALLQGVLEINKSLPKLNFLAALAVALLAKDNSRSKINRRSFISLGLSEANNASIKNSPVKAGSGGPIKTSSSGLRVETDLAKFTSFDSFGRGPHGPITKLAQRPALRDRILQIQHRDNFFHPWQRNTSYARHSQEKRFQRMLGTDPVIWVRDLNYFCYHYYGCDIREFLSGKTVAVCGFGPKWPSLYLPHIIDKSGQIVYPLAAGASRVWGIDFLGWQVVKAGLGISEPLSRKEDGMVAFPGIKIVYEPISRGLRAEQEEVMFDLYRADSTSVVKAREHIRLLHSSIEDIPKELIQNSSVTLITAVGLFDSDALALDDLNGFDKQGIENLRKILERLKDMLADNGIIFIGRGSYQDWQKEHHLYKAFLKLAAELGLSPIYMIPKGEEKDSLYGKDMEGYLAGFVKDNGGDAIVILYPFPLPVGYGNTWFEAGVKYPRWVSEHGLVDKSLFGQFRRVTNPHTKNIHGIIDTAA